MTTPTNNSLAGRVALVTGGSRGLGRAICVHLATAGCSTVIVNYNQNESAALETQSLITQAAPQCKVRVCRADVSDAEQVKRMVEWVVAECGVVSVLVNNAGICSIRSDLSTVTVDDFDSMYRGNLRSAFLCTQATYAAMVEQKFGRIINITSIAAYTGGATGPHYAASKAGMIGKSQQHITGHLCSAAVCAVYIPRLTQLSPLSCLCCVACLFRSDQQLRRPAGQAGRHLQRRRPRTGTERYGGRHGGQSGA